MDDRVAFGARVKSARESNNLTIEEAAELCDASISTWKQYESGDRLPSLTKFKSMCLNLNVKPEFLFGSELNDLIGRLSNLEQLKFKIEQLSENDITIVDAAVSKCLELYNRR